MSATQAQLEAVLAAALNVLGARRDQSDTIDEWAALARAVAVATQGKTRDLLTERDLEHARQYGAAWNEATDGPLGD